MKKEIEGFNNAMVKMVLPLPAFFIWLEKIIGYREQVTELSLSEKVGRLQEVSSPIM